MQSLTDLPPDMLQHYQTNVTHPIACLRAALLLALLSRAETTSQFSVSISPEQFHH